MTQRDPPASASPAGDEVIGFDPASRSWITGRHAGSSYDSLPELDGKLIVSAQALEDIAGDFGHVVTRRPSAILRPGSAADIARMIGFARRHRIKIGARGQAHTVYGQSQVEAGIVIDMRALATIHSIEEGRADVDAGVSWNVLVERTTALGWTPPVLTDFLELTVGGTLSVGGVSGNSFRHGVQVDNVLELEVVTGEGAQRTCSPSQNRDLFDAALAGLGQCGVIVRATLRLVPAPTHVRLYDLGYADLATLLQDVRRATGADCFDYALGFGLPHGAAWMHRMHALAYYTPPALPDDARLLAGLSYQRGSENIVDMPYGQWVNRLTPAVDELRRLGLISRPHPWIDLFVPASRIEAFAGEALAEVSPDEVDTAFPVLFYLFRRDHLSRPLFRVPDEEICFLFDVLRTSTPANRSLAEMLAHNRALYDRNRQWGGTHYPIAAVELSPEDWKDRFGPAWADFAAAKRRYDPDNVLAPGPGIFR